MVKVDSDGNEIWNKTFGGDKSDDWGESVIQSSDGGYFIAGKTELNGGGDVLLIKVKRESILTPAATSMPTSMGFEAISGFAGLLAVVYLLFLRRRKWLK